MMVVSSGIKRMRQSAEVTITGRIGNPHSKMPRAPLAQCCRCRLRPKPPSNCSKQSISSEIGAIKRRQRQSLVQHT